MVGLSSAAIGFVADGVIFVSRGHVHNLTSAANIWLAATMGIAAGAGQYKLVAFGVILGIAILPGVRLIERWIPRSGKAQNGIAEWRHRCPADAHAAKIPDWET